MASPMIEEIGEHDGKKVLVYTLQNDKGMILQVTNLGASIISCRVPDASGKVEEVTLNHGTDLGQLTTHSSDMYLGVTVGRVCNRIANGRFVVDGKEFQLAINNGPNHLHGGLKAWSRKVWKPAEVQDAERLSHVMFEYYSADGEENYPGNVKSTVTFSIAKDKNALRISYRAETDQKTPIALTNHAYWNLSGDFKRSVRYHSLKVNASTYLPVDNTQIPTGETKAVQGTPFDFVEETKLGPRLENIDGGGEPGLDHTFILGRTGTPYCGIPYCGTLKDETSGRVMNVYTTEPGVQVYTGNFLSKESVDAPFTQHNAICMECQRLPNAVNEQPSFGEIMLIPGEVYSQELVHEFV